MRPVADRSCSSKTGRLPRSRRNIRVRRTRGSIGPRAPSSATRRGCFFTIPPTAMRRVRGAPTACISSAGLTRHALRRDGGSLFELRVRLENELAHAILRGRVACGRAQQREAAALAVDRIRARRERDVAPASCPPFPYGEANQLQAVEEPFCEMQFRLGKLAGQSVLVAWGDEFDDHGVLHMSRLRDATRQRWLGGPRARSAWRHDAGQRTRLTGGRSVVGGNDSAR